MRKWRTTERKKNCIYIYIYIIPVKFFIWSVNVKVTYTQQSLKIVRGKKNFAVTS